MSVPNNAIPKAQPSGFYNPLLFFSLFALTLALTACDNPTDSGDNDEPASNEVIMENMSFYPANRTVEPGTTITWVNESDEMHTVTSGTDGNHDGEFDSGEIMPGEEFSYTFDDEGTYDYYCVPHLQNGMTGTITVDEEGNDNGNGY